MKQTFQIVCGAALIGAAITLTTGTLGPKVAMAEALETATTITLPEGDGVVVLEVRTGPLPRGTDLVLETSDGHVLGAVSPFGATPNAAPEQVHHVVAVLKGLPAGDMDVVAKLVSGADSRAAGATEFKGVRVLPE